MSNMVEMEEKIPHTTVTVKDENATKTSDSRVLRHLTKFLVAIVIMTGILYQFACICQLYDMSVLDATEISKVLGHSVERINMWASFLSTAHFKMMFSTALCTILLSLVIGGKLLGRLWMKINSNGNENHPYWTRASVLLLSSVFISVATTYAISLNAILTFKLESVIISLRDSIIGYIIAFLVVSFLQKRVSSVWAKCILVGFFAGAFEIYNNEKFIFSNKTTGLSIDTIKSKSVILEIENIMKSHDLPTSIVKMSDSYFPAISIKTFFQKLILLGTMLKEEFLAPFLAHELGHIVNHDSIILLVTLIAEKSFWAMLPFIMLEYPSFLNVFGFAGNLSTVIAVSVTILLGSVYDLIKKPIANTFGNFIEYRADKYAVDNEYGMQLALAIRELYPLMNVAINPVFSTVFLSHPSDYHRVKRIHELVEAKQKKYS